MRESASQSGRHWAGTHFSRPYGSVHGLGGACPTSGGSHSRLSDMDSRKPAFESRNLIPALFRSQEPSHQAITLSGGGGARFITWRLRSLFLGECRLGSRHFWNRRVGVDYDPALGLHIKKGSVPY